jgi:hypothetical protein
VLLDGIGRAQAGIKANPFSGWARSDCGASAINVTFQMVSRFKAGKNHSLPVSFFFIKWRNYTIGLVEARQVVSGTCSKNQPAVPLPIDEKVAAMRLPLFF